MPYENKIIKFEIEISNKTSLILGTGEDGIDSLQINDEYAKIPATSLAGLFRHYLKDTGKENLYKAVYLEEFEPEHEKQKRLKYRYQSMLVIEDSYSEKLDLITDIDKRTHNSIDRKTGAAEQKKLYDIFSIKKGKTFTVKAELRKILSENMNSRKQNIDIEKINKEDDLLLSKLSEEFLNFLDEIHRKHITIGANGNKGYGLFDIKKIAIKEYNLTNKSEARDYINREPLVLEEYKSEKIYNNKYQSIGIKFSCPHGMIIKDDIEIKEFIVKKGNGETKRNKCLTLSIKNEDNYFIPASTLKGLLRSYCFKFNDSFSIVNKDTIEKIFGSNEMKGETRFKDLIIENGYEINKSRIQVDRFTGGARSGALINEKLVGWKEPVIWNINIPKLDEKEKARFIVLLKVIFREMKIGRFRIGSGSSVGYGKLEDLELDLAGLNWR